MAGHKTNPVEKARRVGTPARRPDPTTSTGRLLILKRSRRDTISFMRTWSKLNPRSFDKARLASTLSSSRQSFQMLIFLEREHPRIFNQIYEATFPRR